MSHPIHKIIAHRAQPVGGQSIPVTVIEVQPTIADPRPACRHGEYESDAVMAVDARNIADALFASLPGGTLDRLTVLFLERKISHFIVNK